MPDTGIKVPLSWASELVLKLCSRVRIYITPKGQKIMSRRRMLDDKQCSVMFDESVVASGKTPGSYASSISGVPE